MQVPFLTTLHNSITPNLLRLPSVRRIGRWTLAPARVTAVNPQKATRLDFRQVIINLVGNAIKFTETGVVAVRVEKLSSRENEVSLRFSVQDTGIGIPVDKQERIFRVFEQADAGTNRKYGGTGL
ncbi:MAG: ATP-binding protein, partial [Kiritimatiellia bacterium]|nr:ATP-binding protein [Kiritimatiellia bacterium]